MTPLIGQWQRLSPWAMAILFTGSVARFLRENVPLLLGAGAGAALLERIGLRELALAALFLLLLGALVSLLRYRRFRFRLDGDVLIVRQGILEQRELKVGAERVQQIMIEQPAYMRPFDVVRFTVDTPGGVTAEVELPGIRRPQAEALRAALDTAREASGAGEGANRPVAGSGAVILFRATAGGLVLHGVASNHAYVAAAAAAPLIQPLERLVIRRLEGFADRAWVDTLLASPGLAVVLFLVALAVTLVLVSVAVAWLRFSGFLLLRDGERFVQRSGLLTRRERTLSSPKLQSVEWVETLIGRGLGRGYLVCRQYGGGRGPDQAGERFIVPALDRPGGDRLAHAFWAGLPPGEGFLSLDHQRVHPLYRRVVAIRLGLLATLSAGALALIGGHAGWLLLIPAALVVTAPAGHLRWLAVGWRRQGRYLLVRRGLLGRRTSVFPLHNIQAVALRESYLQRRHGLATLRLQLASGPVSLPYIDRATALALANASIHLAETQDPVR